MPFCYLAIMGIGLTSCTDEKDTMELGKQAAIEACECLDNGATMEECEEQLNKDYKYDVDDEFIEAFNEAGYCDIVINKK